LSSGRGFNSPAGSSQARGIVMRVEPERLACCMFVCAELLEDTTSKMDDYREIDERDDKLSAVVGAKSTEMDASWEFAGISEVAEEFGFTLRALRFYEEKGLISSIGRRGLHRLFNPSFKRQTYIN
jgi:hypothetical protein